ncbi:MAG: PQQ-binding-like beta-propeller repeat protein, partial [Acidimicrobiia bacterium]
AWDEALEGAEAMLGVTLEALPAWENAARFLKAQALAGLGRLDEAKSEVQAAIAASPDGINGWRWRNRCQALGWRIDKLSGGKWDDLAPADLTEELLAARFYLQAVELMGDRVGFEKDPDLATSAAALALRVGLPVHAARALAGTKRWDEPEGVATAHHIKQITVPETWTEAWKAVPGVAEALATEEGGDPTEAVQTLQADLDAAFESAGLNVDDRRLSPAQRSAAGLRIKQPRQPRRRRRLASFASAAALVLVAGTAGAVAAIVFQQDFPDIPAPPTTMPPPGVEPLPIEERALTIPEDIPGFGAAQWSFRGETDREGFNGDRDGITSRTGVDEIAGTWWKFQTNQLVDASPAVRGSSVMIGSANETFYSIDATTGRPLWTNDTDGPISSSASFAFAPLGEGGENESVVFVATETGTVHGYRTRTGIPLWTQTGPGPITAPLLVANATVYAPSEDGYIYAFQAAPPGDLSWRFPAEGSDGLAPFVTAPLFVDGNLIAVTATGTYVMVNGETGDEVCRQELGTDVNAGPTHVDNLVYVGTPGALSILRANNCGLAGQHLFEQFLPMYASPLVDGNYVYVTSGTSIIKFDLLTSLFDWRFVTRATIRSSPVLAGDLLYFGADNGTFYAVDADTGEEVWSFQTDGEVRSSPAVADGAIYVGSRDGNIYALGGSSEGR